MRDTEPFFCAIHQDFSSYGQTCVNYFLGGLLAAVPSGWTVLIFLCFLTATICPCGEWKWHRDLRGRHLPNTSLCLSLVTSSDPGNLGPLLCDLQIWLSTSSCGRCLQATITGAKCASVYEVFKQVRHMFDNLKKQKQSVICSDGIRGALSECMCFI